MTRVEYRFETEPGTPFDRLKESLGLRGWLRRAARRALRPAGACPRRGAALGPRRQTGGRVNKLSPLVNRVRTLPRPCAALLALVLALSLAVAGCGNDEPKTSGAEGEFIEAGEADYQVQLTRLLNPQQRPDDAYLRGQARCRDEAYLGVFLRIKNDSDSPYKPPRGMKVVDTAGNEYLPLDTTQSGFGLDFGEPIPPDGRRAAARLAGSVRPDLRCAAPVPAQGGVGDGQPPARAADPSRGRGGALQHRARHLAGRPYSSRSLASGKPSDAPIRIMRHPITASQPPERLCALGDQARQHRDGGAAGDHPVPRLTHAAAGGEHRADDREHQAGDRKAEGVEDHQHGAERGDQQPTRVSRTVPGSRLGTPVARAPVLSTGASLYAAEPLARPVTSRAGAPAHDRRRLDHRRVRRC